MQETEVSLPTAAPPVVVADRRIPIRFAQSVLQRGHPAPAPVPFFLLSKSPPFSLSACLNLDVVQIPDPHRLRVRIRCVNGRRDPGRIRPQVLHQAMKAA